MKMTRKAVAQRIASELDCTTKIWVKEALIRVYLSHRGKDYGYVSITNTGIDLSLTGYASNTYGAAIHNAVEGIEILKEDDFQFTPSPLNRTVEQIVQARNSGDNFTLEETKRVLDAWYGKDNWDDRDRIDFEG